MDIIFHTKEIKNAGEFKMIANEILSKHNLLSYVDEIKTFQEYGLPLHTSEANPLAIHTKYDIKNGIRTASATLVFDLDIIEKTKSLHKYIELLILHEGKHAEYLRVIMQRFNVFKLSDKIKFYLCVAASGILSEIYADYEVSKTFPDQAEAHLLALFQFDIKALTTEEVWGYFEREIFDSVLGKASAGQIISKIIYHIQSLVAIRYSLEKLGGNVPNFMYSRNVPTEKLEKYFLVLHNIIFEFFIQVENNLFTSGCNINFQDEVLLKDLMKLTGGLLERIAMITKY